jgi:hypothetical protein
MQKMNLMTNYQGIQFFAMPRARNIHDKKKQFCDISE